jgi:hypothetical protein
VLGFTSQVLGYALLAIAGVLLLSPAIEGALGTHFSIDRYPKVPRKRKMVVQIDQPISHVLMASACVIALMIIVFGRPSRIIVNKQINPTAVTLRLINGKTFDRAHVPLDGNEYVDCIFKQVTLEWNGGPYALINVHVVQFEGAQMGLITNNRVVGDTIGLLGAFRMEPFRR